MKSKFKKIRVRHSKTPLSLRISVDPDKLVTNKQKQKPILTERGVSHLFQNNRSFVESNSRQGDNLTRCRPAADRIPAWLFEQARGHS